MPQAAKTRLFSIFASLFFVIGVVLWILLLAFPNLDKGADQGIPLWLFAAAAGLVGTICASIGIARRRSALLLLLVILDTLLIISPFLIWTIGTMLFGP